MKRNAIRLTESALHGIIRRCVNEALSELCAESDVLEPETKKRIENQLSWSEKEHDDNRKKEKAEFDANRDEWNAKHYGKPSRFNRNIYGSTSLRRETRR